MAIKIGVVSQKGGVGKSTLSRLIACEYAKHQYRVKIADMDISQGTCTDWNRRRLERELTPVVAVEQYGDVARVLRDEENYDLIVFDGAPHSTRLTEQIAKSSDLVVIPTSVTIDDMRPTVKLAYELKQHGIPKSKVVLVLNRVSSSPVELQEAYDYIQEATYKCLGDLPEKTGYHRALDNGYSLTETPYESLNEKADALLQAIIDKVETLTNNKELVE